MKRALLLIAALTLAGCSIWPSTWRIGGSPLDKNERAQKQLVATQGAAVAHAQAAVHKAESALETAPAENRSVVVARDFVSEARALLDQANGAPSAADEKSWRDLVAGLVSENAEIRARAERERATQAANTAEIARRLSAATLAAERANERALSYARDREQLADFAAKLKLGFFAIVALLVIGSVLSVVARFFPQVGLAAKIVNGVVAPGITFAAHRAQVGLRRVGAGIAKLREIGGASAESLIEQTFDGVITDADHRQEISAAASAAGNGPKA